MLILKHYTWLIALAVSAIWFSAQIAYWPESIQTLVVFFPYVSVALGIFIALWLNRIQPVLILLSLGCFNAVLFYFSSYSLGLEPAADTLFPVLIVLLPLNILLWIIFPEKGVFNKRLNTLVLLIFLVQAAIIYWLLKDTPEVWLAFLNIPIFEHSDLIFLSISTGLMFLLTLFFIVLKMSQSSFKVLYHAVFMVLVLMLYGVNQGFNLNILAWFSAFSAIALTLSMIFEAHHIAYTDELTGILGRRALMESFLGLGKKYTVAMVDIDHFKKFNDTYGHDVGDEVLRRVARVLDKVKEGRAFRYGGEEFTLIFANKKIEEVLPELEYIRRKVESGIIEFKTGIHSIRANVTISIGVAQSDESFKAQDILKFADQALYKAKLSGRNQVVVGDYSPSKVQINHYKKGSKNDEKSSGIGHSTE
jgi:diguanylate cyclase (GGDEF)-like protein